MSDAKSLDSTRNNHSTGPAPTGPEIPAGDMPPQPVWRLIAASAVWGLWIVFLFVMMWMRIQTASV